MKNIIASIILCLIGQSTIIAQTKQHDIVLMPALKTDDKDIANYGKDYLLDKMNNEIIKNGCISNNIARFVLVAQPTIVNKNFTGQSMLYTYSFQFSVVDILANKTYSSFSMQLGGIGQTGGQAFMDALRRLDLTKSKLESSIKEAVAEITSYYNANCSNILANASTLLEADQFEEAVATITQIPDLANLNCKPQYNVLYGKIAKRFTSYKCSYAIQKAKKEWALNPTKEGVAAVSIALDGINLSSDCQKDFNDLINEIKKKLQGDEFDEKTFRRKIYEDAVALEKDRISAMRDIAVEYYKKQINNIYLHL